MFSFDHLIIIPYNKIMQINLNVIKTVSYNHEAVIIKISSRVSAIMLICGTYLIKAVGVYIFKTLVGVLSLLENVRFVCFLFWFCCFSGCGGWGCALPWSEGFPLRRLLMLWSLGSRALAQQLGSRAWSLPSMWSHPRPGTEWCPLHWQAGS